MSESRLSHIWFLRKTSLFEDQSESMYSSADARARHIDFDRGDVIQLQEGARKLIYVLMSGQVKLCSVTEGGKEIIFDVLGADDVFGPIEAAVDAAGSSGPSAGMRMEAIALTRGAALQFEFDYFSELVRRRPTLVVNLSRILGLRRKRLELRLGRLLYRSSLGKVAGLLVELGERYGTRTAEGVNVDVRLTHQEMASVVGIKRETVSEALAELEHRGLITVSRNRLTLLRPEELDRIA